MAVQRKLDEPIYERPAMNVPKSVYIETMTMPDGTRWNRDVDSG
jgi:hypothetical protein